MITKIITIGNSKGIRIPKPILEASGVGEKVELEVKKGEIKITPAKKTKSINTILSEKVLAVDWNRKEEDKAWENLK